MGEYADMEIDSGICEYADNNYINEVYEGNYPEQWHGEEADETFRRFPYKRIVAETDKAYLIELTEGNSNYQGWFPKSHTRIIDNKTFWVSFWLGAQKAKEIEKLIKKGKLKELKESDKNE